MLRYIGSGFIPGVPARDLTDAEAAQYGQDRLIASGLYILAEDKAARPQRETKGPTVVKVESAAIKLRKSHPQERGEDTQEDKE